MAPPGAMSPFLIASTFRYPPSPYSHETLPSANYPHEHTRHCHLRSGVPLVRPAPMGSPSHPQLAVVGDKQCHLCFVDPDGTGRYGHGCSSTNTKIVQQLNIAPGGCITCGIFE